MWSEWRTVALSDVADLSMGETLLSKNLTGDGIPVFSANTDEGPWGYTSNNRRRLRRGDIVIGARGSIGYPRRPNFDAFTCTQTTIAVEPDHAVVNSEYLHYALCAADILGIASQQAVPMLTIGALSPLEITLPKIDEQRRIAEVLRSVDEAIAANEAALASCRGLVGKLARDVTESCEATTTMASLGKIVTGRTPSPKQAELWGGDLPFVTPGDLVAGNISVSDASRTLVADSGHGATVLPANSVLVTCIGSTVGKTAIARERCVTNQQINAICCPPQIAGFAYLASVAAYDTIVAHAGKQAVPIINKSTFSAIEVPALSQADMIEISAMVDAIDGEIVAAQTSLETLHRTKANLMSDLLSGRVRVPA
ncbi:MAG: restriction endonuclease subunit S [Sphingomonadales bacterium]|nr:restriction endonuclease subunit S [Sphingomonadales bacterium]